MRSQLSFVSRVMMNGVKALPVGTRSNVTLEYKDNRGSYLLIYDLFIKRISRLAPNSKARRYRTFLVTLFQSQLLG